MAGKKEGFARICPRSLGIALGVIWGVSLFLTSLLAAKTGYALGFIGAISSVYIGYGPGAFGGLLGLVYGFLDGFIGGYLMGWLYNRLVEK